MGNLVLCLANSQAAEEYDGTRVGAPEVDLYPSYWLDLIFNHYLQ